jgi:hypothetical protein
VTPIQEYADVVSWVMQERGYTVGDKDNHNTDITLNVSDSPRFILIGSSRDNKSWGIVLGNGQNIVVIGRSFNLADPDSLSKIGDLIESEMKGLFPMIYQQSNYFVS